MWHIRMQLRSSVSSAQGSLPANGKRIPHREKDRLVLPELHGLLRKLSPCAASRNRPEAKTMSNETDKCANCGAPLFDHGHYPQRSCPDTVDNCWGATRLTFEAMRAPAPEEPTDAQLIAGMESLPVDIVEGTSAVSLTIIIQPGQTLRAAIRSAMQQQKGTAQ